MLTTIAIADDHTLIAKALAEILHKLGNYEVLYEVENGLLLTQKFNIKTNIPDVVLLDVSMPIMNGYETAAWLKANHPEVRIIALSMQDDEQSLIKMIQSGASGYLLKNIQPKELDNAIQSVLKRGYYYPDWATSKVFLNIATSDKKPTPLINFTAKELELFKYVCTEMSYKEIAQKMYCSPRTVESYRDSLFEKLELKSRVGLAVYAIKHNLTE